MNGQQHGCRRGQRGARRCAGVTLVELLVAMTILAILALAATELMGSLLAAQATQAAQASLDPEAERVLESMAAAIANTTTLAIPNGRCRTTSRLVLSANIDNDGDGRVDEDPGSVLFGGRLPQLLADCGCSGAAIVPGDDDADGVAGEDPIDGIDNDGDGSIDEDPPADANGDGAPGVRGRDDDGDGSIDEGSPADDDEDGLVDEDGPDLRQFYWDSQARALYEERPGIAPFVVLAGVDSFRVTYCTPPGSEPLVELRLEMRASDGATDLDLWTRVFPANLTARHGITLP